MKLNALRTTSDAAMLDENDLLAIHGGAGDVTIGPQKGPVIIIDNSINVTVDFKSAEGALRELNNLFDKLKPHP